MELYLVQHGEARPEHEDPERALSDRGRAEVVRVARRAGRLGVGVDLIRHSGKLRARQTAEILAEHLKAQPPEAISGLSPNDDPTLVLKTVEQAGKPLMLVGHLPHLGRLASLLLVGDPERPIIAFRMAGIVSLARQEQGWRLRWILTPELASE